MKDPEKGELKVIKRTLVARNGNRFKLDRALRENVFLQGEPKVESLFPLFSGENIADVTFENITLDGNKANNQNLDGNYAGCIWMQDCIRITMRNVTARNYNGDGISWQICHDVLVEDCHSHDHTGLGLHPGSGSQRTIIRRNRLVGNDQGLFFCWGVRWGLAEKNIIEGNKLYGISIGHHDTDNVDSRQRSSGERRSRHSVPERGRASVPRQSKRGREEPHYWTSLRTAASESIFKGRQNQLPSRRTKFAKPRRPGSAWAFGSEPRRSRSHWLITASTASLKVWSTCAKRTRTPENKGPTLGALAGSPVLDASVSQAQDLPAWPRLSTLEPKVQTPCALKTNRYTLLTVRGPKWGIKSLLAEDSWGRPRGLGWGDWQSPLSLSSGYPKVERTARSR